MISRNQTCPCGSGNKYKYCCGSHATNHDKKTENSFIIETTNLDDSHVISNPSSYTSLHPCHITLAKGGEIREPSELLFGESLPNTILSEHYYQQKTPDITIYFVPETKLFGTSWILRNGKALFNDNIVPKYCHTYFTNEWTPGRNTDIKKHIIYKIDRAWHITHFNCPTYGHWLLEGVPKLLYIKHVLGIWPEFEAIPIIMPKTLPRFVSDAISAILPNSKLVLYNPDNEIVHVNQLLLPTYGNDYFYHPFLNTLIDETISHSTTKHSDLIFVSRKSKSHYRHMSNSKEIEQIAINHGLEIIYPEEHTIHDQMSIFAHAKIVVGEFGSALHNAIFSNTGTKVIALNWINSCQSRIANLREHRICYVLPRSGTPVTYQRNMETQDFEIDPDCFTRTLNRMLEL